MFDFHYLNESRAQVKAVKGKAVTSFENHIHVSIMSKL